MLEIINVRSAFYNEWRPQIKELLKVSSTSSFPNTEIPESYYNDKCIELEQYLSEDRAVVFLAVADEKAIGFIWIHPYNRFDELRLHISHFAVLPQYQRLGVGTSLYQKVVAYAKKHQFGSLELLVSSSDTYAVNFYDKCGFKAERYLMKKQI